MFSLLDVAGLPALPPIEVLDVGARIEGRPRWAPLVARRAAHVTAFEPQAEDRARLEALGIGITCLPHVLGDGGPATFHITHWPGNCSLYEPDPAVVDAFHGKAASRPQGGFHVVSTREVQTTRLDDVPGLRPPDFIKLDIQAAELLVLQHGKSVLRSAVVVEAEAMFVTLYRDQPLFGELQVFMRQHGFAFHRFMDLAGLVYRPLPVADPRLPVSQPGWADAVFVRDPFRLSAWGDADLVRGAVVLHDLYGSFDLAMRLLAEHDARRGSRLADAYADRLRQAGPLPSRFVSLRQLGRPAGRRAGGSPGGLPGGQGAAR